MHWGRPVSFCHSPCIPSAGEWQGQHLLLGSHTQSVVLILLEHRPLTWFGGRVGLSSGGRETFLQGWKIITFLLPEDLSTFNVVWLFLANPRVHMACLLFCCPLWNLEVHSACSQFRGVDWNSETTRKDIVHFLIHLQQPHEKLTLFSFYLSKVGSNRFQLKPRSNWLQACALN